MKTKIRADTGEFVNRKGIYPPLGDADKIKFVQMYQFGKEDYEIKEKRISEDFSTIALEARQWRDSSSMQTAM